jgi:hypothetical protein
MDIAGVVLGLIGIGLGAGSFYYTTVSITNLATLEEAGIDVKIAAASTPILASITGVKNLIETSLDKIGGKIGGTEEIATRSMSNTANNIANNTANNLSNNANNIANNMSNNANNIANNLSNNATNIAANANNIAANTADNLTAQSGGKKTKSKKPRRPRTKKNITTVGNQMYMKFSM